MATEMNVQKREGFHQTSSTVYMPTSTTQLLSTTSQLPKEIKANPNPKLFLKTESRKRDPNMFTQSDCMSSAR